MAVSLCPRRRFDNLEKVRALLKLRHEPPGMRKWVKEF